LIWEKQAIYRAGLTEVRNWIQKLTPGLLHVAQLSPEQQVQLMEAIVPTEFFTVLRKLGCLLITLRDHAPRHKRYGIPGSLRFHD
jgi:hypothetical protein